jgi:hypothetical protein
MARVVRNAVAAALISTIPVSTTVAAVRPNAAVPVAGSTAVAAQGTVYDDRRGGFAETWPIWLFAAGMAILVAIEVLDDDDDFAVTRG